MTLAQADALAALPTVADELERDELAMRRAIEVHQKLYQGSGYIRRVKLAVYIPGQTAPCGVAWLRVPRGQAELLEVEKTSWSTLGE